MTLLRRIAAYTTPRRILVCGWLLFLIYAYPGYLSPDPVQQLSEARAGNYSDWHPPMMGFLWKLLEHIIAGTFGMLVLQSAAFLFGLARIAGKFLSPRRAALVAVAILLFPPVLTTMAVIWKDSQMAGYLLAGTALVIDHRLRVRLAGCVLLALGSAMRYNALGATLPIVVLLFEWRVGLRWWHRYSIAFAIWLGITLSASQANKLLTDWQAHTWYQCALHDITGIVSNGPRVSDSTIEDMLPGVLRVHHHILTTMKKAYLPWSNYYLSNGDERIFDFPSTDEQREIVAAAWKKLVLSEPWAYLRHRYNVSKEIINWTENPIIAPVWDGFPDGESFTRWDGIGVTMTHSDWQAWWVHSLRKIGQSLLFRAYMYMIVALVLIALRPRSRLVLALVLSGLCYEGTLFIAAVPDARYSHWMITCITLSYLLTMVTRYRNEVQTCPRRGRDAR